MASRSLDGPEKDLLTIREVAEYLRLTTKTLRRLVAEGKFFAPVEVSPGVKLWTAEDVAVYRAWRERQHRLRPPEKSKRPEGQP